MQKCLLAFGLCLGLTTPALAGGDYKPQQGKMSHCPNVVEGAKTAVENTKDGVDITVTAADAKSMTEIRNRAKFMAQVSSNGAPWTTPDGNGHGGGDHGHCPVVVRGTKIAVKDVDGGAKVTLQSRDPGKVVALQKTVATRVTSMRPAKP
jgi:hypothetical protein